MLSQDEIRGDWSNLKGTEYHLVYAIWLLLREEASEVAFYEGNDLRAEPIRPPALRGDPESFAGIPLRMQRGETDVWIQLKATCEPWTPSDLLEGNLLENFVCNALTSQRRGRRWEVRLVTQAIVRRKEVLAFAEAPEKQPKLVKHLDRIVASVKGKLENEGGPSPADDGAIRSLALGILKDLCDTDPVALAALKAEIETELAYARPSRHAVRRTANLLVGAMLTDAAAGPARGRPYDVNWLNEVAGPGVKSEKPFDRDEALGCDVAVVRALPPTWNSAYHASRTRLKPLLRQFLAGRASLFVLLGSGGTGKTWALSDWTAHDLAHGIRLLVPASTLDIAQTLDGVVATALSPLTGAVLKDEEYLERLCAAAVGRGAVPPAVVVDDLQVSQSTADTVRKQLARLTRRARETGVKLVVACQTEAWELYHLWREIPSGEIFVLDPTVSEERRYSFVLDAFSPDERTDAVTRRLPAPRGEHASLQLRGAGLLALRSPYLLGLYFDQHGAHLGSSAAAPDPVVVDDLLRQRVRNQVGQAASLLGASSDAVETGLASLVERVWAARPSPPTFSEAIRTLSVHLPDQGKEGLEALQRVGLVVFHGGVRFAEDPVANHLFAAHLVGHAERGGDLCSLLVPERDGEVAAALIRNSPDPVSLADRLVRSDARWAQAASTGLSQCSPGDLRVIATLTGLARSADEGSANFEQCCSLGLLAARGGRAWDRVLTLYLSDDSGDRRVGEVALGAALEVVPEQVGEAIRTRLALENDRGSPERDEDRLRRMTDALGPLHQIVHRAAANVGRNLLPDACRLVPTHRNAETPRLLDAIDDIRGRVALFGEEGGVAALCAELGDLDLETRYRAAGALRPAAFEAPDYVRPALLERFRVETDPHVLSRVLWMAPRVVESSPDEFLAALRAGVVSAWRESAVVGPALAVLGIAARQRPADVLRLLPRRLDACEPRVRALVSELLVYAWWATAESEPTARAHLAVLAEPDLEEVPDTFRTFALRGAAVARLAELCLGRVSVNEMGVRMVHFRGAALPEYLFLDADEFFRQHAATLIREPGYPRAEEALLQCVRTHHDKPSDVRDKDLQNARYFCAGNSLEILTCGWAISADPLPGLNALPRDWEALRAARQLLEAGRSDAAIVAFARKACDDSARQHTMQAWHERELCLVELARLGDAPQAELKKQQDSMAHSFFGTSGRARGLTALADEHPDELLSLLDGAISKQDDIPLLYDWGHDCRSWQAVLVAGVYARMFQATPLEPGEARDLVDQMLVALRGLPASPERLGPEALYATLASWFGGNVQAPVSTPFSATPIGNSHALAVEVLVEAARTGRTGAGAEWLHTFLGDRRGWWETTSWQLKDGKLSRGSGLYLIYVFPAVRLALAAAGRLVNVTDPGSSLMEGRCSAWAGIHRHHFTLTGRADQPERLERALADLEGHRAAIPRDERLWNSCGNLLLRLGRVDEARDRLSGSLRLASCSGESRATALYDLACVEARSGRNDACREALDECRRIRPLDASWMAEDPDLQSVRDMPWFQDLIQHPSDCDTQPKPSVQPPAATDRA
jgi:hypothetical protein